MSPREFVLKEIKAVVKLYPKDGKFSIDEFCQLVEVPPQTGRRFLDKAEKVGICERVPGFTKMYRSRL